MQIFSAGRTGRTGQTDQPKVVQEVLADLKRTQERYMLEAGYTKLNIDGASISLNGL